LAIVGAKADAAGLADFATNPSSGARPGEAVKVSGIRSKTPVTWKALLEKKSVT
jgi:hypothetical protein